MVARCIPLFLAVASFVGTASLPHTLSAQPPKIETGTSSIFSKMNPMNWMSSSSSTNKTKTVSQKKSVSSSNQPGFWSSVGTSTRSAWNKTTDFLNPFDDKPKKKKSEGFFSKLTKPAPEPRPISTVGDFLQQKHPY